MPDLSTETGTVIFIFGIVTFRHSFLESGSIVERSEIEAFRGWCEDGSVLGKVSVMRLSSVSARPPASGMNQFQSTDIV